jgi:anaerobic selenocysteine-containing dehydrogenase
LLWGHNPHASIPPEVRRIENAIRKGAKLIVIDPRRISFAKKADIHVQPRPGTDGALALAMLNTIITESLYDREFVEKWTVGFEKLAEHVKKYPAEEVERITQVPASTTKEIARTYAKTKPACIVPGTNTLDQQASGFQNTRAIAALESITGNIDVPGGSIRVSGKLRWKQVRLPDKLKDLKLIGAEKYPISYRMADRIFGGMQSMEWPDIVLTGKPYPIKTGIVAGANPAIVWPNSHKVRQALEKLDFFVVLDIFMTETAEMADIVLPAATFLERTDISAMGGDILNAPYVILRKPVMEPLWESWPDWKF